MGLPATASVVRRSIPPCHGRGTPYRGDSDRKRGFRPLRRRHGFKSRGRRSGRIGREWKQAVAEQLVHEASRDGTHTRVHVAKSTCTTVRAEVRNGCGCKPHNRQCQSVRTDSTSRVALLPAGYYHSVRARPCAQYRGDDRGKKPYEQRETAHSTDAVRVTFGQSARSTTVGPLIPHRLRFVSWWSNSYDTALLPR
jgi:hypothetical protein